MGNTTDADRPQEAVEASIAGSWPGGEPDTVRAAETNGPRPTWLPNGCPAWCDAPELHVEHDHYDDRLHTGAGRSVILTAADECESREGDPPDEARMFLRQHYREIGPRIELGRDDKPTGIQFTPDEAEEFAARLLELVAIARAGQGVKTVDGHPAWCAEHHEEVHLLSVEGRPGPVHMQMVPGLEPDLSIQIDSDRVMSIAEAEGLTRTLLDLTSAARRNRPVE
ncbi:hypothetical protein [Actinomadura sp. WMMA1423]|uniref:DUF6907 domain-containing protein n=1 Tax=Actinomadura sp. WMMA1423 TaxID=2591108 RepID=UPI0011476EF7|nr:hypothetical protein [Actinomadura sp. WMMA1423]